MIRRYDLYQPKFNKLRAISNIQKLSDHFIEVFRSLHKGKGLNDWIPEEADLRCNMMATHLFWFEMAVILAPDEIKVDIFDLLCSSGGAIFRNFIYPSGMSNYYRIRTKSKVPLYHISKHMRETTTLANRFKEFYRFNRYDCRRHKDDKGKTEFFQIWQNLVPDTYKNDRIRAERVGTLIKFCVLTFSVNCFNNPFYHLRKISAGNGCKR